MRGHINYRAGLFVCFARMLRDERSGDDLPHEPLLTEQQDFFSPFELPDTQPSQGLPRSSTLVAQRVAAWLEIRDAHRVGVCKHCGALVLFPIGVPGNPR